MTKKVRTRLFLGLATISLLTIVCLGILELKSPPYPGKLDEEATKRISEKCTSHSMCQVHLGELIPGDWDTFFKFGYSANQEEVNRELGTSNISLSDLQDLIVLEKNGRVVRKLHGDIGQGQPLANQIVFNEDQSPRAGTVHHRDDLFQVTRCTTMEGGHIFGPYGGTYFMLTPVPIDPKASMTCQAPSG